MASNDERLLADFLRAVNSVLSSDDVNELLLELDEEDEDEDEE